jgi:hypothetical protein
VRDCEELRVCEAVCVVLALCETVCVAVLVSVEDPVEDGVRVGDADWEGDCEAVGVDVGLGAPTHDHPAAANDAGKAQPAALSPAYASAWDASGCSEV